MKLILLLLLTSCASQSIYYWGHYEELLYKQYQTPGEATPENQVLKLEEDIQIAKSKNKPLPPGFYAHLGYQYLQMGKTDEAKRSFEAEKTQFPESAVLMDRFLSKFKKGKTK
jgi:hypothetical protein